MKKILLIGSYGRGNIGDDAFLLVALSYFRDNDLFINSADDSLLPRKSRKSVKTIHTHSLKDLRSKFFTFFAVNEVYYWGGDVWVKYYGEHFPRKPLYKMIILNTLLRLMGKDVFYVGCGIGALRGYDLWLARLSARFARTVIVRDKHSQDLLRLPHTQLQPDLTIKLIKSIQHKTYISGEVFKIGISLLYHIHNPRVEFPKLINELAVSLQRLKNKNIEIVLLPMLNNEKIGKDDLWSLTQLQDKLSGFKNVIIKNPSSVSDFLSTLATLHVIIGARLHANILATYTGIPAIGIAYRLKVRSFFNENDIGEYCINIEEVNRIDHLIEKVMQEYPYVAKQFYDLAVRSGKRDEYEKFI